MALCLVFDDQSFYLSQQALSGISSGNIYQLTGNFPLTLLLDYSNHRKSVKVLRLPYIAHHAEHYLFR